MFATMAHQLAAIKCYYFKIMKKIFFKALKLSPFLITTFVYCKIQDKTTIQDQPDETGLKAFNGFKNRQQHLSEIQRDPNYDIIVIGGGASGAGVCFDASTRGLRTLVIEKNDFGSGTSSKSTKLIHGGVRYLQQVFAISKDSLSSRIQKFKLVTEAIKQRGYMIQCASYMNSKIPFVIPTTNIFQSMYYYGGLIMYYLIYQLSSDRKAVSFNFPYFLHRNQVREIFPYISDKYSGGVVYEDGRFNDARMLLMTLLTCTLSSEEYSYLPTHHTPANILNKAEFIDFIKKNGMIEGVVFEDKLTSKRYQVKAKYVVNCTGVWADEVRKKDNQSVRPRICIVGGSHLTYDSKISSSKFALCLPSKDGRVLMVVPWLNRVIAGTTEKFYSEPVDNPTISMEQRQFIQQQMSELMDRLPQASQLIMWEKAHWAGLRPLVLQDGIVNSKSIARNHVIERSNSGLYSLMGGKWTTFRKMGEDLVNQISKQEQKKNGKKFNQSKSQGVRLVGSCSQHFQKKLINEYGFLGVELYQSYGSLSTQILKGDLTPVFCNVTKAELDYILKNEMVTDVEDVILRRLRIAFLHQKQKTLQGIPYLTRQIVKIKNQKLNENQIQQKIKFNIQKICSYEFD